MKTTRFLAAIGVACAIALSAMLPQAAVAQTNWSTPGGANASGAVGMCLNASNQAVPCSDPSALPSPVSGTFSATLAGFTPNNNFATLTATASTSGSTAMPAGAVVGFQNTSSVDVSCVLSAGAATATTNKIVVRAGATVFLTVGSNVNAACINQTGSASNVVVMAGGTGLGTNFGGSSGGGGGGAITAASGSYASGALSSGSMVDLGSQADAACGTDNGSCSAIALIKRGNQNATAVNTSIGSATPAGTNIIGKVGIDQTAPGTTNGVQVNAALPAGANLIGKTGIDQTADGTTNGVRQTNAYPSGATPITASATGTTAATTATLAGTGGKTTYICGYSIRANATAAATVTNTITGVITATLSSIMWVAPLASGIGVDEQIFTPCIPASATNTGIAIVSGAPGAGGTVSSKGWGYQQ